MFEEIGSDPWFAVFVFTICLIVGVVVFLILRAVVLWYWRINDVADSLHWIATHLADINKNIEKLGMSEDERKKVKDNELNYAIERMKEEGG